MNNLNLPQVASNQNQKEVTINDQAFALDAAITEAFTVDLSSGGVTLTAAQFTRNVLFILEGAAQPETVTLPEIKRLFAVANASSEDVDLEVDAVSVTVPAGSSGFYYSTEASIIKIG